MELIRRSKFKPSWMIAGGITGGLLAYNLRYGIAFFVLTAALVAVGFSPEPAGVTQDSYVDFKLVHEEIDGGADSGVSPDGKWITFSHGKSGNREIYAVSTENGEVKNLTNSPQDEWEARWHPDGKHIVFTGIRNNQNGVFIMNLETGEEITVMSTEGYEDYPSFSKDGSMVSFTAGPMGSREVYTWNWETREIKQITRGHNYVGSTNFSADGKQVVYHAYYGNSYGSQNADVFVVDAEGGEGVNITHTDNVWVYKAQWSPHGEWIAFSGRYDTPKFNIWVMRPDGSALRRITNVEGQDLRWADWTQDGRLTWHGIKSQRGTLYAVDVSTGERREIMGRERHFRSLTTSPDGATVAYEVGGEIFVMDATGRAEPRELVDGMAPRFSPDGQTISFVNGRRTQIGMVAAAGGEPTSIEQTVRNWPDPVASGWSPDGTALAVITSTDDGQELTLISPDGTTRALTDDGFPKGAPVWSADGRYIFYAENQPNRVAYYITTHSVTDMLNSATEPESQ